MINLGFSSKISGLVDCLIEDISASPPRPLRQMKVTVAEGSNLLSLATERGWAGLPVRITFVSGGTTYTIKGVIPATP